MLHMVEQSKWSLEMECPPGEDAGKAAEWTMETFRILHTLCKSVEVFERIDFNFEGSTVDEMLSSSFTDYTEIVCERQSQSVLQTTLLTYLNCHSHPTFTLTP